MQDLVTVKWNKV